MGRRWRMASVGALVVGSGAVARADCGTSVAVLPPFGSSLPTNGRIIVQSGGLGSPRPEGRFVGPLMLEGGGARLALVALARTRNQVVLAPERALAPNTRYDLVECPADGPCGKPRRFGHAEAFWAAGPGPDLGAPQWTDTPEVVGYSWALSAACDYSAYATVYAPARDDWRAILIEVQVSAVGGGPPLGETLIPLGPLAEIAIGHFMCGYGPIDLLPGGRYRARLVPVDHAGNRGPSPKVVEFDFPKGSDLGSRADGCATASRQRAFEERHGGPKAGSRAPPLPSTECKWGMGGPLRDVERVIPMAIEELAILSMLLGLWRRRRRA